MSQNQESRSGGLLSTNISTQRAPTQHQPTNRTWTMANVISSDHRGFSTNLFLNKELDRKSTFGTRCLYAPGSFPIIPGDTVQGGGDQQQNFNIVQNQEVCSAGLLSANISTHQAQPQPESQPARELKSMHDVEADGSPSDRTGDPPGQQSIYIPPGNYRKETYRLSTFENFPVTSPISRKDLAKNGFYFLGYLDRVKCFSCAKSVEKWVIADSPSDRKWHKPTCPFMRGEPTGNTPILNLMGSLAALSGSTSGQEEVIQQRDPNTGQVIRTVRYPADLPERVQRSVNYPLRSPQNPDMREIAQREQTFDGRWPAGRIRVTPAQVAEAGFFYLGERDRVKCWYCNGGLQNWELGDIPWDEHAKWFPNCKFLLRTKGQQFVSQRARLISSGQDESHFDPVGTLHIGFVRGPDISPPTIVDPQEELRKRKERVKNIMKNSEVVKNVLAMGFAETIVETLLIGRISANKEDNLNDIYGTVSELLDDVMKKEEEIRQEDGERRDQTQSIFSNPSAHSSMSGLSSIGAMAPGSGKYNASYSDDEDMYGSMEGASISGSSNVGSINRVQIQNRPVRQASQPREVSEPQREVLIRPMVTVASQAHRTFPTNLDIDLNRERDRTAQQRLEAGQGVIRELNGVDTAINTD